MDGPTTLNSCIRPSCAHVWTPEGDPIAVGGYCSERCRDMHGLEERIRELEDAKAPPSRSGDIQALEEPR